MLSCFFLPSIYSAIAMDDSSMARYVLKNSGNNLAVEIRDGNLYVYTDDYYNGLIPATVCTVLKEECGYYRIKSIRSIKKLSDFDIEYDTSTCIISSDSVAFEITLPNYSDQCVVSLYYGGCEESKLCRNKVDFIMAKKGSPFSKQYFDIIVYPVCYTAILPNDTYAGIYGCYYGNFIENKNLIEDNTSKVICNIKGITKDYFSQFYIKDEYIKIMSDALIWRGLCFNKMDDN